MAKRQKQSKTNVLQNFYHSKAAKILSVILAISLSMSLVPLASYKSLSFADDAADTEEQNQEQIQLEEQATENNQASTDTEQQEQTPSSPATTFDFELCEDSTQNIASINNPIKFSITDKDSGTLPKNSFSKDKYTFTNWSNTPDGNDIIDDPSTSTNEYQKSYIIFDEATYANGTITCDINKNGTIEDNETLALSDIAKDNKITLYAQWKTSGQDANLDDSTQGSNLNSELQNTDITALNEEKNNQQTTNSIPTEWVEMQQKSLIDGIFTTLFGTPAKQADNNQNDANDDPTPSIKTTGLQWTTINGQTVEEAQKTDATVKASNNTTQTEKMTFSYQFDGEENFEPGEIQITIPSKIWSTRDGKLIGDMELAVPADPSTASDYSYVYDQANNQYIITNVKTIKKDNQGYMQFKISHMPSDIKDGQVATCKINMTTAVNGEKEACSLDTNEIKATLDTEENISSATQNTGSIYTSSNDAKNNGLASEEVKKLTDPDSYLFVRWYTYAEVQGSKPFTLSISSSLDATPAYENAIMLYSDDGGKTTKQQVFDGYVTDGTKKNAYVWAAIPKSNFTEYGYTYKFNNTTSWTLKECDDLGTEAEKTPVIAKNTAQYVTPRLINVSINWKASTQEQTDKIPDSQNVTVYRKDGYNRYSKVGDIVVYKDDEFKGTITDDVQGNYSYTLSQSMPVAYYYESSHSYSGTNLSLTNTYYEPGDTYPVHTVSTDSWPTNHQSSSIYDCGDNDGYALAKQGNNTTANVHLTSSVVAGQYCYDEQTKEIGGKTYYSQLSTESFSANNKNITASDFQISKVTMNNPVMYSPQTHEPGMPWGYEQDIEAKLPEVNLYGSTDGTNYVLYATAMYFNDTYAYIAQNGASSQGNVITLPENVITIKSVTASNHLKIDCSLDLELKFFATGAVSDIFKQIFANADQGVATIKTVSTASLLDNNKVTIGTSRDNCKLYLHGYNPAVNATSSMSSKLLSRTSSDTETKIQVTQTVTEQSNITSWSMYNSFVSQGLIPSDKKDTSTYYSLLPLGAHVDISSVALQSGDRMQNAYVVSNYKDTGRDMLVVKAVVADHLSQTYNNNYPAGIKNQHTLVFNVTVTDKDYLIFGKDYTFNNVFEGGDTFIGNREGYEGEPDDPTITPHKNNQTADATVGVADLLKNLDPNSDKSTFLYSKVLQNIDNTVYASASFNKYVYADGQAEGDTSAEVLLGQGYSYQLMYGGQGSATKDAVIVDMFEDKQISGTTYMQGVFDSIDTTGIEANGIEPKIYYQTNAQFSAIDGLYQINEDGNYVIDEEGNLKLLEGWTDVEPANKADIKGIAIDAFHDKDGNEVTIDKEKWISAIVHMTSPQSASITSSAGASNTSYMHCILGDTPRKTTKAIDSNAAQTTFKPLNIDVSVNFDDDNDRDGIRPQGNINAKLLKDGVEFKNIVLEKDKGYSTTIEGLYYSEGDTKIAYSVVCTDEITGYTITSNVESETKVCLELQHSPAKAAVEGTITWADDEYEDRPDNINVYLYGNDKLVSTKATPKIIDDEWQITFDDMYVNEAGKPIAYSLKQDSIEDYFTTYPSSTAILNTYYPYGDLRVDSTYFNTTAVSAQKAHNYTIELYDEDGVMLENTYKAFVYEGTTQIKEIKVASNGNFEFIGGQHLIIKDLPSRSTFKIVQDSLDGFSINSDDSRIRTGDIAGCKHQTTVSYNNYYSARYSFTPSAEVVLQNKALQPYEFIFSVYKGEQCKDETYVTAAMNDANGVIKPVINFTQNDITEAGSPKIYSIKQNIVPRGGYTQDTNVYQFNVSVADNGDGTLDVKTTTSKITFTNIYNASGTTQLGAFSELEGGTLVGNEFDFELYKLDAEGTKPASALKTAKNNADGSFLFEALQFSEQDIDTKTIYLITETEGSDTTINYSKEFFGFEVEVLDAGNGTLYFNNKQVALKVVGDKYVVDEEATSVPNPIFVNTYKDGTLELVQTTEGDSTAKAAGINPYRDFKYHVVLSGDNVLKDGEYEYTRESVGGDSDNDCDDENQIFWQANEIEENETQSDESSVLYDEAAAQCDMDVAVYDEDEFQAGDSTEIQQSNQSLNENDNETQDITEGTEVVNSDNDNDEEIADYAVLYDNNDPSASNYTLVFQKGNEDVFDGSRGAIVDSWGHTEWETGSKFTDDTISGGYATEMVWGSYGSYIKSFYFYSKTIYKQTGDSYWSLMGRTIIFGLFSNLNLNNIYNFNLLDISSSTSLVNMFSNSSFSLLDLSSINTSNITDMNYMFSNCSIQEIKFPSSFITGTTCEMGGMFDKCTIPSLDLSSFKTSNVTDMSYMFCECSAKSIDLSSFDTTSVTNMGYMFWECTNLISLKLGQDFQFKERYGYKAELPNPGGDSSAKWKHTTLEITKTGSELMDEYNNNRSSWAGNWISDKASYNVKFEGGEGVIGSMVNFSSLVSSATELPNNLFYKLGYDFAGWTDGENEYPYTEGSTIKIPANTYTAGTTVTLTPIWSEISKKITIANSSFDLVLHKNEKVTLPSLPAGCEYRVYQETPTGWVLVDESVIANDFNTNSLNTLNENIDEVNSNSSVRTGTISPAATTTETFTDKYTATASVGADLSAKVTLADTASSPAVEADRDLFTFNLCDSDGNVIETVKNTAGGNINFSQLNFTIAGTYTYTIKQDTTTKITGITYDETEVTATIEVTDDGSGNLSKTISYDKTSSETPYTFKNIGKITPEPTPTPETGTLTLNDTTATTQAGDPDQTFTYNIELRDPSTGIIESFDKTIKRGGSLEIKRKDDTTALTVGMTYTITSKQIHSGWALDSSKQVVQSGTVTKAGTSVEYAYIYSVNPVSTNIIAKVELAGRQITEGEFSASLTPDGSQTAIASTTNQAPDLRETIVDSTGTEVANDNYGRADFCFTKQFSAATKTDTPEEFVIEQTNTTRGDISYASNKIIASVTVTDNCDGTLSSSVAYTSQNTETSNEDPVNLFKNSVIKAGDLCVETSTSGILPSAAADKVADYKVVLRDSSGNELTTSFDYYSDSSHSSHVGKIKSGDTVKLKQNSSIFIVDIPQQTSYSVTQTLPAGFSNLTTAGNTGTTSEAASKVQFNNAYTSSELVDFEATVVAKKSDSKQVAIDAGEYSFSLLDEDQNVLSTTQNDESSDGESPVATFAFSNNKFDKTSDGKSFRYYIMQNPGTDETVAKYDEGIANIVVICTDNGDGTITTNVTYEKNAIPQFTNYLNSKYVVKYVCADTGADVVLRQDEVYAYAGTQVTPEIASFNGYAPLSTEPTTATVLDDNSLVIEYKYTSVNTAAYTVNHYLQKADLSGYELADTETLTGNIGASVSPSTKEYAGYKAPNVETVTVGADGLTTVYYYYNKMFTITFDTDGGSEIAPITQLPNTKVEAPDNPVKEGFTFVCWEPEIPETMPAKDITVRAKWNENPVVPGDDSNAVSATQSGTSSTSDSTIAYVYGAIALALLCFSVAYVSRRRQRRN